LSGGLSYVKRWVAAALGIRVPVLNGDGAA